MDRTLYTLAAVVQPSMSSLDPLFSLAKKNAIRELPLGTLLETPRHEQQWFSSEKERAPRPLRIRLTIDADSSPLGRRLNDKSSPRPPRTQNEKNSLRARRTRFALQEERYDDILRTAEEAWTAGRWLDAQGTLDGLKGELEKKNKKNKNPYAIKTLADLQIRFDQNHLWLRLEIQRALEGHTLTSQEQFDQVDELLGRSSGQLQTLLRSLFSWVGKDWRTFPDDLFDSIPTKYRDLIQVAFVPFNNYAEARWNDRNLRIDLFARIFNKITRLAHAAALTPLDISKIVYSYMGPSFLNIDIAAFITQDIHSLFFGKKTKRGDKEQQFAAAQTAGWSVLLLRLTRLFLAKGFSLNVAGVLSQLFNDSNPPLIKGDDQIFTDISFHTNDMPITPNLYNLLKRLYQIMRLRHSGTNAGGSRTNAKNAGNPRIMNLSFIASQYETASGRRGSEEPEGPVMPAARFQNQFLVTANVPPNVGESSDRLKVYENGFLDKWRHALELRQTEVTQSDLENVYKLYGGPYGRSGRIRGLAVIAKLPKIIEDILYNDYKDFWSRLPDPLQLKLKLVPKNILHMTLAFSPLQEALTADRIHQLKLRMTDIAAETPSFHIRVGPDNFFREEKAEHVLVTEGHFESEEELDKTDALREVLIHLLQGNVFYRFLFHFSWAYIWSALTEPEIEMVMGLLQEFRNKTQERLKGLPSIPIQEISLQEMNGLDEITSLGTYRLEGIPWAQYNRDQNYNIRLLRENAAVFVKGPLGQQLMHLEEDILALQKDNTNPQLLATAQKSWARIRASLEQFKKSIRKPKPSSAPGNKEERLMQKTLAYYLSNALTAVGFLEIDKIPVAESANAASAAVAECHARLNALLHMQKILLLIDPPILDVDGIWRWDELRDGIAVLAKLPMDLCDDALAREQPWIALFGAETFIQADRKRGGATLVTLFELFIEYPDSLYRLVRQNGKDVIRQQIVEEPLKLKKDLEDDILLYSPEFQQAQAKKVFQRVNDTQISGSEGAGLHQLTTRYNSKKKTWDFKLRSLRRLGGIFPRLHLGAISGQGSFLFQYDPRGSTLQILSNVRIEDAYVGNHLYTKIIETVWDKLPEPTIVWQMAPEQDTLENFYDSLPEKVGYRDQDRNGTFPNALTLVRRWAQQGRDRGNITTELRYKVWQALTRPSPAVIPPEVIALSKLGRPLSKGSRQALTVIANPGGVLWIRAIKGNPKARDEGPQGLGDEWLIDFHNSLQQDSKSMMASKEEEETVRAWERLFVSRFYDRFEMLPTALLLEIRNYLKTGVIDTWEADSFLEQQYRQPNEELDEWQILRRFHHFLGSHDHMRLIQNGWPVNMIAYPEMEKAFRSQMFESQPLIFPGPSADWAMGLAKYNGLNQATILELLQQLTRLLLQERETRRKELAQKIDEFAKLKESFAMVSSIKRKGIEPVVANQEAELKHTKVVISKLRMESLQKEREISWKFIAHTIEQSPWRHAIRQDLSLLLRLIGLLTIDTKSHIHNFLFEVNQRVVKGTIHMSELAPLFRKQRKELDVKMEQKKVTFRGLHPLEELYRLRLVCITIEEYVFRQAFSDFSTHRLEEAA